MKIRFNYLSTLAGLLLNMGYAQAQECSCAETFEQVVQVYENDYALFSIKVTEANKALYTANKEVFRKKAAKVSDVEECLPILEHWLQFFRDGHNYIRFTGNSAGKETRESIAIDKERFLEELDSIRKIEDNIQNDLLGIWKYGGYEVGIMPKKGPLRANLWVSF